ncbi:peptide chain release factor H [Chromobacterium haemolyticum]|uniref:Peptide chain release factor H n=1 Tax=Chromobacterium haemolyticum TaxID=394935 RepID=A0A1W0CGU7_9NEIS|nr:peptide chain release factor H [Chromobacterium haemolyticum]OQS34017.1 peptide chain release factor H [Chromobacterium haemolyticum]
MILLQFSAAQGPEECCLAVAKALARLQAEAEAQGARLELLEREDGPRPGTLRSALLSLEGEAAEALATRWTGTLQWRAASPYRPRHPRKNWFIGVARCPEPAAELAGEIRFETLRASGPGGQHVNRTESAVRATHLASGISVKVQSERSQHANKRLALRLIALKLEQLAERDQAGARAARRLLHHQVARGNPSRVFVGERFETLD